jgi:hypothetical protein
MVVAGPQESRLQPTPASEGRAPRRRDLIGMTGVARHRRRKWREHRTGSQHDHDAGRCVAIGKRVASAAYVNVFAGRRGGR